MLWKTPIRVVSLLVVVLTALSLAAAGSATTATAKAAASGISGVVRGQVCVKGTKICYFAGIPNLFVVLSGTSKEHTYKQTVTAQDGSFSFNIKPGTYYLVVTDGHGHDLSPTTDAVKVKSGQAKLTLFLSQGKK